MTRVFMLVMLDQWTMQKTIKTGQTLLNLIQDEPLQTDQLLKFGFRIAEALEAAH